jgi:hypothetical protein
MSQEERRSPGSEVATGLTVDKAFRVIVIVLCLVVESTVKFVKGKELRPLLGIGISNATKLFNCIVDCLTHNVL